MSLLSDLTDLEEKEGTLTDNKVINFSYNQASYVNDDADGVEAYDFENDNNIPVGEARILALNETVCNKGLRSKASSLSRMAVNHFFGRVSYNLNKTVDVLNALLTALKSFLGQPYGFATLDSAGRIPYNQLPESAMEFMGTWNANTNTPEITQGVGLNGQFYVVSVAGTWNNIKFYANDRIIFDGNTSQWTRLEGNALKVPIGFIYPQLYNPTTEEWEASPEILYPANLWTEITSAFASYPYLKIGSMETGEGHNAEHYHGMQHKHRMEHTHSGTVNNSGHHQHGYLKPEFNVQEIRGGGSSVWYGRTVTVTEWAGEHNHSFTTGSSAYTGSYYTGNSITTASANTSDTERTNTDNQGSGTYPEPNFSGCKIWKCVQ